MGTTAAGVCEIMDVLLACCSRFCWLNWDGRPDFHHADDWLSGLGQGADPKGALRGL